jgi:hypothetical protein
MAEGNLFSAQEEQFPHRALQLAGAIVTTASDSLLWKAGKAFCFQYL